MDNFRAEGRAPGKVILFGEHAVVYGRPAIAVPVAQVQATATIENAPPGGGLTIVAADLGRTVTLSSAPPNEPLAAAAWVTLGHLGAAEPDAVLTIRSTIPIAGGLGSGAAVSAALIRALAAFLGRPLPPEELSPLVFEVEKIHHDTPSGIDNTVVVYEQPVYFMRGREIERVTVGAPLTLLIADSGTPSPTGAVVADVRRAREQTPAHYETLFDRIGDLTTEARAAIAAGKVDTLGPLMDANHELLTEIGVSSPVLDRLVEAARKKGALGAKLSGAGRGGNIVALVREETASDVEKTLLTAGARRVIRTRVRTTAHPAP